jgi:hypothetical protein
MQLKRGIFIHNQMPEGHDAISINSGTVFHTEQPAEMVNFRGYSYRPLYEEEAYVVKRDWRSLMPGEVKCLEADDSRNDYNTVYLGNIPEILKSRFEKLQLAGATSREEVMNKLKQNEDDTRKLNEAVNAFLQPLASNEPFLFHCLGINFPNIEMVACDTTQLPPGYHPQDVRYIGIHNDGTAKMTIHTAHKFGNRISINLGKEPRSFLFVNLSMIQAFNMLKTKIDVKKAGVNIRNMPRFFFKHFPGYPVLRVQQKPYQYYIAPTDNCFHDGSTLGNSTLDITFVYFGAFTC